MRFSKIIGDGFFGIKLTAQQFDLLDRHFVAAAHHRYRFAESGSKFHNDRYYEHMDLLMSIVRQGDFSGFFRHPVLIKNGFDKPSRWVLVPGQTPSASDPQLYDSTLFSEMCADVRWNTNQEHPYDVLLDFDLGVAPNISLLEGAA